MSSDNEVGSNISSLKHHKDSKKTMIQDLKSGISLSFKPLLKHFFEKYAILPITLILMLCLLYGVNEVIKKTTVTFPASVCLMLILYGVLCITTLIFGEEFTEKYLLKYLNYPCGFSLRWMNVYFTPAFIILPLSSWVSAGEAFTITAVFIFGYLIGYALIGYICWGLQILFGIYPKYEDNEDTTTDDLEKGQVVSLSDSESIPMADAKIEISTKEDNISHSGSHSELNSDINSDTHNDTHEDIPYHGENNDDDYEEINYSNREGDEAYALSVLATNTDLSRVVTRCNTRNTVCSQANHEQVEEESQSTIEPRDVRISNFILKWIDYLVYFIVFIVGIPIYFTTDYGLPLQLGIAVLLFRFAMLPPASYRRILHPILVSFSITLLIFYIFTLIKGEGFLHFIRGYKTGRSYLHLFDNKNYPQLPGAGDMLISLMDISIVSLALAMYNYRKDLKKNFFVLIISTIMAAFMSLFIYPPLCYHIGISASRSLGFTGRSVTLALGTPLVQTIDGDYHLMAVTTIVSGMLGVLCGDILIFKLMRVRKRDFVTRGITLGVNCGAVSTAHLLTIDPRAAAMSSLSFTLFGTFMLILVAIDPLVRTVQSLVGW